MKTLVTPHNRAPAFWLFRDQRDAPNNSQHACTLARQDGRKCKGLQSHGRRRPCMPQKRAPPFARVVLVALAAATLRPDVHSPPPLRQHVLRRINDIPVACVPERSQPGEDVAEVCLRPWALLGLAAEPHDILQQDPFRSALSNVCASAGPRAATGAEWVVAAFVQATNQQLHGAHCGKWERRDVFIHKVAAGRMLGTKASQPRFLLATERFSHRRAASP